MNEVLVGLGIDGTCIRAEAHRHLAFYDISLARKPSVLSKLERSTKEIALHLRTKTVPIVKLVSKEGIVRLQVALQEADTIPLMDIYQGELLPKKMIFPFLLGEDDEGQKLWMDMNHNPHLLVAGASGSGKSSLLHTIISNALYVHALRSRNIFIYLSDPKRVEFPDYKDSRLNDIILGVASNYNETIHQLQELYNMMEQRYHSMRVLRMRSIEEDPQKIPLVLCVIDEVSDLFLWEKNNARKGVLQDLLVKLAQKGRAAGIFLVLSTQRPSVDVLTGLIKANFPGRIACKTASRKDSEVILDRPGAETLLGRGDAMLQNMKNDSVRFQVAFTTPQDTIRNFSWLTQEVQREMYYHGC